MSKTKNPFLFLGSCDNLQTLILSGNKIPTTGIFELSNTLKRCKYLSTLDLESNNIDKCLDFLSSLVAYPNLCSLNLRNTLHQGSLSESVLASLQNCGNLHTIDISNTTFHCSHLVELIKCCENLRVIFAAKNNFSDDDVAYLAKFCGNLQLLDLGFNEISDNGACALAQCFKGSKNLQKLHLNNNKISDAGVKSLAEALKVSSSLLALNLGFNIIENEGIESLALSLRFCSQLNLLDLSSSSMSVNSAESLAETLTKLTCLCELHLNNVSVDNDGAIALAFCFKQLRNLRKLSFHVQYFSDGIAMAFAYGLQGSDTLRELNFKGNGGYRVENLWMDPEHSYLKDPRGYFKRKQHGHSISNDYEVLTITEFLSVHHRHLPVRVFEELRLLIEHNSHIRGLTLSQILRITDEQEKYPNLIEFFSCKSRVRSISEKGALAIVEALNSCLNLRTVRYSLEYEFLIRLLNRKVNGYKTELI